MAEERFLTRVAKQRDAEILRSVLMRFSEHGCFDTTLDHVSVDVGIGKGTLYRHYPSREDLFEAALQAGIDGLMSRCRSTWETHAADADAAFRALIGDLVALNHRGDPMSPATLAGLCCHCRCLNPSHLNDGKLVLAFTPLVRDWQAAGLFDRTTDSSWIAAATVALVNSLVGMGQGSEEPAPVVATRIVEVLRRSFAPPAGPIEAVAGF